MLEVHDLLLLVKIIDIPVDEVLERGLEYEYLQAHLHLELILQNLKAKIPLILIDLLISFYVADSADCTVSLLEA
jgi:hypothetical protein